MCLTPITGCGLVSETEDVPLEEDVPLVRGNTMAAARTVAFLLLLARVCEPQLPAARRWADVLAGGGVWAALAADDALPFLLTDSPASQWPAMTRWTPQYLGEQLVEVPSVRRSAEARLLFYTVDTWSQELARNEEFWRLVDGGNAELAASALAPKTFRWAPPHVLHPSVPATKVMAAVAGRGKPGAQRPHVYAAVDLYSSAQSMELLSRDVTPADGLLAVREDDPARWRANLWVGSQNTTATPHYDSYHNLVVQLFGQKRWRIAPPAGLLQHSVYPLGHPSARQLQNTTADILLPPPFESARAAGDGKGDSLQCATLPRMGFEFVMNPGDVLALPAYWLHEVAAEGAVGASTIPCPASFRTQH